MQKYYRKGPQIAMTDDLSAERNALYSVWPDSVAAWHVSLPTTKVDMAAGWAQLNCKDHAFLINKTKHLVYAESESMLLNLYDDFQKCSVVNRYPNYLSYIKNQWDRRKEWALCYRKHLLVRGNQTTTLKQVCEF